MPSKNGSKTTKNRRRTVKKVEEPKSPLPPQHQSKPGSETKLKPRPRYEAPLYTGAGKLKEKVALITGGDSGIGRAVAVLFAREGADVAFTFLKEEKRYADETRRAIQAEGQRAFPMMGDVRDPKVCQKLVDKTVEEFGKLDILVNNAAFQQHQETLEDVTEEQWDQRRDSRVHKITGAEPGGAWHSRELCRAWTSVDAVESSRPGCERRGGVWRRHTDEASGSARRDCAGIRLFRVGS